MNLTDVEQALLKKLGIKLPKEAVVKEKKSPGEHRIISLVGESCEVILHCVCCKHTERYYANYVKRSNGDEGYTLARCDVPAKAVTRKHESKVASCGNCKDDSLINFSKEELVDMIKSLRNYPINLSSRKEKM